MWMVGRSTRARPPGRCFRVRAIERGHQYKCKPSVQDLSVLTHTVWSRS